MAWKNALGWVLAGALMMVAGCAPAPAGRRPAAHAAWGAAPYFVTLAFQRPEAPAVVTDAVTGKKLGVVHPPVSGTRFSGVAAAGDDHTFVLAAEKQPDAPAAGFYELHLTRNGHPRPLVLLPVPLVACGDTFAVSPDGSKLVIGTGTATRGAIEVVSLASGAVRAWPAARGRVSDLSWAGDRHVAFQWWDGSRSARVARSRSGVRLLDTAAAGRGLMGSRLIVHQSARTSLGNFTAVGSPLISANGSRLFATVEWTGGGQQDAMAEVVEFSARTGQALSVVTPPADESGMGTWCGALWTDPSGTLAAAICARAGSIDRGHFTSTNLHVPRYNASTPRDSFIAW
jgi:hypothetical protein